MNELEKHLDTYFLQELAARKQHGSQYGNPTCTLYVVPEGIDPEECDLPAGTKILVEDDGAETTEYLITDEDMSGRDESAYVDDMVREWADNEDHRQLALCLWGLSDIDDYAYAGDSACVVSVEKQYNTHRPTNFARDERGDVLTFDASVEAQAWVDEQEAMSPYYLDHNEHSRPRYAIWEA